MGDIVETFEHAGRTIEIHYDTDPENPREWDNLGTMVCFHRRYNLGDKTDLRDSMFSGWDELRRHLVTKCDAVVILPLYLMDHSGLILRTDSSMFEACDSAGWDWGQVGFIYISREKMRKEYSVKRISKQLRERVAGYLRNEVETQDDYLNGRVYGFVIKGPDDENEDSCWGMWGLDYCREQAKESAEHAQRNAADQAECAYA